jgi:WD40 repeat protein
MNYQVQNQEREAFELQPRLMKTLCLTLLLLLSTQVLFAQEPGFQVGHTHDILAVKFSPDDSQLISYSAGDGRLILWDVRSGAVGGSDKNVYSQNC